MKFYFGLNPVIHAKRLKNLQKLKEEDKFDKYLNLLTEEELDIFFKLDVDITHFSLKIRTPKKIILLFFVL